jgi:hypothetical protein
MRTLHAFRGTMIILGLAVLMALGLSVLPEREYQRWQLLDGTIHARSKWIYERINFDPQPIDVVFVGPSRVGAAIDAPRLSEALAQRGLPSNVVNFSLPETGRNINYVIVEELLEKKQPKLIVIGVVEKPSRLGHPAFKFLAPRHEIVNPGYASDLNYLTDLVYIPFRQAQLFAAYVAPGVLGPSAEFRPETFRGHSVDTTGDVALPDGRILNASEPGAPEEIERGVRKLEAQSRPPILPPEYAEWEFGDERHYVREIARLAKARGVKVAFLFLPYYSGPSAIQEEALYRQYGPIWMGDFTAFQPDLYFDYAHLTSTGADLMSDWLVTPISEVLQTKGQP